MKTLTLRIPDNLWEEIEAASKVRRVNKSDIVRERLARYRTRRSAWDRIKHLTVDSKDLPADLSANPKYLENYGRDGVD